MNKSEPARVLVVVLSCNKYRHLWDAILAKGIEDLIILVGHEDMHDRVLSHAELTADSGMYLDGQILYLGCNDCYEGLPVKIVKAIEFILKSPQFAHITHILKVDDHDTAFDKGNVVTICKMLEATPCDYMGQKLNKAPGMRNYHVPYVSVNSEWRTKWYTGEMTPWLHGGSSYVLSRLAMTCVNNVYNCSNIRDVGTNEIFEDVMVAKILHRNGIMPKEVNYGVVGDRV